MAPPTAPGISPTSCTHRGNGAIHGHQRQAAQPLHRQTARGVLQGQAPDSLRLEAPEISKKGLEMTAVVAELGLIRALRTMDVPLPELKRILEVRRQGHCNCNALKSSIQTRIQSIDQRLTELVAMKAELAQLLSSWQECGGSKEL